MSTPAPQPHANAAAPYLLGMPVRRRTSWMVVRAMAAELLRQERDGGLLHAGTMNDSAQMHVGGTIDLVRLADVTEQALRAEFKL